MGSWFAILPEERTNHVKNPIALGSADYGVVSGTTTFAPVTTYSYMGYKCYRAVVDGSASQFYCNTETLSGVIHYVTYRMHTASDGTPPEVSLNLSNWYSVTLIGQEGSWNVYGAQVSAAYSSGGTSVAFRGQASKTYYIGHVQCETGTYPTTPIHGDMIGNTPDGYYWKGARHAAPSLRQASERGGGVLKDLTVDYGFSVMYGVGSGMPPIKHQVAEYALGNGALFQGSKVNARILDLFSTTAPGGTTATVASVRKARKNFINAIKPDLLAIEQPVTFRYTGVNITTPVDFRGYYDSGLEFNLAAGIVEKPTARFICYDPFCYEPSMGGMGLSVYASVANGIYGVRNKDGDWENLYTTLNGAINCMAEGLDKSIIIGGNFTDVGTGSGDYIVRLDPFTKTYSAMGTGANLYVKAVQVDQFGNVYAAGSFTLIGGVTGTAYIGKWTGSAWTALDTSGLSASVTDMAIAPDGKVVIVGNFLNAGGYADADYICYYEPQDNNFYALNYTGTPPAPPNTAPYCVHVTKKNQIVIGGTFTTIGGKSLNRVAMWDWTTNAWYGLGTGVAGSGTPNVSAITSDDAGNIYVAGYFQTANGVDCTYIAMWNGVTFVPLGSGLDYTASSLYWDSKNQLLYVGGDFYLAGGVPLREGCAVWNGSTWAHLPANLPGTSARPSAFLQTRKELYIGMSVSTAVTTYTGVVNTITNNGSSTSWPVIHIKKTNTTGTMILQTLKNETTGDLINFHHTFMDGEEVTIDFTPGKKIIVSSFNGKIWKAVMRASDFAQFRLLPGANRVSIYCDPSGTVTYDAWVEYKITHWAADMVAA